MKKFFRKLWRKDEGAGLVEYALLIVIISLAAVVGMGILGGGLNTLFTSIGQAVSGATVPAVP